MTQQPSSARLRWLAIALAAVAAALIALVVTRGDDASRRGDAPRAARPTRDVPGGLFGGGPGRQGARRPPPDVWGALTRPAHLVRVEGQVVEATTGEPVTDVDVVFAGPDGPAGPAGESTATVDGDGRYAIDVTPGTYRPFVRGDGVISVGAAGWERLPGAADPATAGAVDGTRAPVLHVAATQRGVDLSVERAGIISGRVVDAGGRAVVGAAVRTLGGAGRRPVLGTDVAETDAAGRFRLEVPVGYYALDAAHPDHGGLADPADGPPMVEVLPGQTAAIELRMVAGCVITGRAVRPDGSPAGDGAIERGLGGDAFTPAGQLDADGRFRFTTALTEEVSLRAWPWKSAPAPAQTVACHDGARHELTFVVPDAAPDLVGKIVDASGDAVPMAFVDIYGMSPGTMNQQERGDPDGGWAVFALPPGDYAISAHVPGQGAAWVMATVPGPEVVLRLSGTGSLAGRVEGIDDGTFLLEIGACAIGGGAVGIDHQTILVPVRGGRYRVDGLPACRLSLAVRAGTRYVPGELEVRAGEVVTHDLDVSPPRAKTVRVRVRNPDGSLAAGAMVVAMGADAMAAAPQPMATDAQGEVTIAAHVGDLVHAFVQDSGAMGSGQVSDAPGDHEDLVVTLEPPYVDDLGGLDLDPPDDDLYP